MLCHKVVQNLQDSCVSGGHCVDFLSLVGVSIMSAVSGSGQVLIKSRQVWRPITSIMSLFGPFLTGSVGCCDALTSFHSCQYKRDDLGSISVRKTHNCEHHSCLSARKKTVVFLEESSVNWFFLQINSSFCGRSKTRSMFLRHHSCQPGSLGLVSWDLVSSRNEFNLFCTTKRTNREQ